MPEKTWEILEGACGCCQKCRLWETRTHVVIGDGNQNADIMFIGEGPWRAGGFTRQTICGASREIIR